MEFLKSATTFFCKGSNDFGFSFGEKIDLPSDSFWRLYNGIRKEDGLKCSLFVFENASFPGKWPLAQNALSKLRVLHYPHIIRYLNSKEVEGDSITIATERVTPLNWDIQRNIMDEETLLWGLYQVAVTLNFIHGNALSIHGNVRLSSIFINESGEWKIFGLELFSSIKEEDSILNIYGGCIPDSYKYIPPEIQSKNWRSLKRISPKTAIDIYNLGCLIYEIFNGTFKTSSDLIHKGKIPHKLFNAYKKLLNSNPAHRPSISKFIEYGHNDGSFFRTRLIECSEFLEYFSVKDNKQRDDFLRQINDSIDKFNELFLKFKILPGLIKSFEFSEGGNKVFLLILKIGTLLSEDDYNSMISPFIIRMFSNQNRSIRHCLLENLPNYANYLSNKIINDKIFPKILTGFNDIIPLIREETIKAILFIVPKLSEHNINNELLKHLAKTQNDEQPGIRTNTTICLGKIAKHLKPNNRRRILISAFTKSLQDPFVHARIAALMALSVTCNMFNESDCCLKLIPTISPALIDSEKSVRLQAKKTIGLFLQRATELISEIDNTSKIDNSDFLNSNKSNAEYELNSTPFSENQEVENNVKNHFNNSHKIHFVPKTNVSDIYKPDNITTNLKINNDINIYNNMNNINNMNNMDNNKTYDLLTFEVMDKNENYINNTEKYIPLQPNKSTIIKSETNKSIDTEWEQNTWDSDWNSYGNDDD
ncbi:hypothetical protein PCANB_000310 [Pneumocystis canis]|nr:hypothetical protein PCK1_000341 [Pneumocystis canis]KAG5437964.1 hypothetical protein PCANB_000310 [Pneumocystis canis]